MGGEAPAELRDGPQGMANQKVVVTQAELRRYLKAVHEAGFGEGRVVIERPDGTKVSIVAGRASEATGATDDFDELIGRIPDAAS